MVDKWHPDFHQSKLYQKRIEKKNKNVEQEKTIKPLDLVRESSNKHIVEYVKEGLNKRIGKDIENIVEYMEKLLNIVNKYKKGAKNQNTDFNLITENEEQYQKHISNGLDYLKQNKETKDLLEAYKHLVSDKQELSKNLIAFEMEELEDKLYDLADIYDKASDDLEWGEEKLNERNSLEFLNKFKKLFHDINSNYLEKNSTKLIHELRQKDIEHIFKYMADFYKKTKEFSDMYQQIENNLNTVEGYRDKIDDCRYVKNDIEQIGDSCENLHKLIKQFHAPIRIQSWLEKTFPLWKDTITELDRALKDVKEKSLQHPKLEKLFQGVKGELDVNKGLKDKAYFEQFKCYQKEEFPKAIENSEAMRKKIDKYLDEHPKVKSWIDNSDFFTEFRQCSKKFDQLLKEAHHRQSFEYGHISVEGLMKTLQDLNDSCGEVFQQLSEIKNIIDLKMLIVDLKDSEKTNLMLTPEKMNTDKYLDEHPKVRARIENSNFLTKFRQCSEDFNQFLDKAQQYRQDRQDLDNNPDRIVGLMKTLQDLNKCKKDLEEFKNIIDLGEAVMKFRESQGTQKDILKIVDRFSSLRTFRLDEQERGLVDLPVKYWEDLPVDYWKIFLFADGLRVLGKSQKESSKDISQEFKKYHTEIKYQKPGVFLINTCRTGYGKYSIEWDIKQKEIRYLDNERYDGLNLTDISWGQLQLLDSVLKNWQDCISKDDWDKVNKDNINSDSLEFNRMIRQAVGNEETRRTIAICIDVPYTSPDSLPDGGWSFTKGSENYISMFRTPNCYAPVYLVAQRLPHLEIAEIEIKKNGALSIIAHLDKK